MPISDEDGAPLPGVQVVATGPVGSQTQFTGVDGTARFPGLYPGTGYTATFTLDGFKTVIREGLEIAIEDINNNWGGLVGWFVSIQQKLDEFNHAVNTLRPLRLPC